MMLSRILSEGSLAPLMKRGLEGVVHFDYKNGIVTKTAKNNLESKILHEVKWIESLPPSLKILFPKILKFDPEKGSYDMQLIPANSISDDLNTGKITASEAVRIWKNIFETFCYHRVNVQVPPQTWITQRFHNAIARWEAIKKAFPEIDQFSIKEIVEINGQKFLNLSKALEYLKILGQNDFEQNLNPPFIYLTHQDMNLANILNYAQGIVIDPRGDALGDPVYDLMKLAHNPDKEYFDEQRIVVKQIHDAQFELGLSENLLDSVRDRANYDLTLHIEALLEKELGIYNEIFGSNWQLRFWFYYATSMLGRFFVALDFNQSDLKSKIPAQYLLITFYLNQFIAEYLKIFGKHFPEMTNAVKNLGLMDLKKSFSEKIVTSSLITAVYPHVQKPRQVSFGNFEARMKLSDADKFKMLNLAHDGKIMEFGCGTGNVTRLIKAKFSQAQIFGVDFNAAFLSQAREKYPDVVFLEKDLKAENGFEKLKDSFDSVIFSSFLHEVNEVTDQEKIVAKAYEILKKRGAFIFRDGVKPLTKRAVMLRLVTDYAGEKFRRFVHEFKMRKIKYKFLNTAKNIVRLSNHDLHDFLTKYYFEGELWERDMNENFGIRNKAEYYKFFAKYFEISYIDTYTPDYLKNLWTRDFQMLEGGFPFSHILLKGIKIS